MAALSHVLLLLLQIQPVSSIRGIVVDAQSGEPLARVRIALLATTWETVTDDRGRFSLPDIQPGGYTLQVSTVGYRLLRREFDIAAGEVKEFEVVLSPDMFRQTESVEVRSDVFEPIRTESASELTMLGSEVKNLASVLADDPLRAVHAMPGISSNDDFNATFSLRGASFRRIGLYADDVLLHSPFHAVNDEGAGGSLTIFNGDMVQEMSLMSGAFPARYGDRGASILDVQLREGSRSDTSFRGTASASNAGVMAEGPIRRGRGSWMGSLRKSYLQYIIRRTSDDPTLSGGFWDAQGRASYDLTPAHSFSLSAFQGNSGVDRAEFRDRFGLNELMLADYRASLATLGWRWSPARSFTLTSRGAWIREKFENQNRDLTVLGAGHYGEWVWNTSATRMWSGGSALDAGFSLRRSRDSGFENVYQFNPTALRRIDEHRGTGRILGSYVQQIWVLGGGRVRLTAGVRSERYGATGDTVLDPRASVALQVFAGTRLQFGWGTYSQSPELAVLKSRLGRPWLGPERSIHYTASVEQRIGDRTRFRAELYQRLDRDLLLRPFAEPRVIAGRIYNPPIDTPFLNSSRAYARGVELMFQKRTANRFTGWVSYALSYSRWRDGYIRDPFWSDFDQRHTVNVYAGYRIRPTVNLSSKWIYGTGFPVPGFFRREENRYFLVSERNTVRLDPYQRVDVRVNKAYVFDRWKLTLYAEAVNLFNHRNRRYSTFNGYNSRTGQAWPGFDTMFPILPSAGVMLEF